MRRSQRLLTLVASIALLLVTSSVVAAAQKAGCPSATSGWRLTTPTAAAEDFYEDLLPGHPFETVEEFAADIAANADLNGDGAICTRRSWGDELNPNSNWYGIHALSVRDNTAGAQRGED